MKLVTDRGCFNTSLQRSCIFIAGWFLVCMILNILFNFHSSAVSLTGFILELIANCCLLYGALKEKWILVVVWLAIAALFLIGWPIAVFGVIFNFGGYRQAVGTNNVFVAVFIYIITLIIYLFCIRLVYSYYKQLRGNSDEPRTNNVV